jgi:hypothetical protein
MVIYWSLLANKKIDLITFSLFLIKRPVEKYGSGVLCTLYGCPFAVPPPKRLNECHFLKKIPVPERCLNFKHSVCGVLTTKEERDE